MNSIVPRNNSLWIKSLNGSDGGMPVLADAADYFAWRQEVELFLKFKKLWKYLARGKVGSLGMNVKNA